MFLFNLLYCLSYLIASILRNEYLTPYARPDRRDCSLPLTVLAMTGPGKQKCAPGYVALSIRSIGTVLLKNCSMTRTSAAETESVRLSIGSLTMWRKE